MLRGGTKAPQLFQIVGSDSLGILGNLGRPIQSLVNYPLVRAPQTDPVRGTMRLRGAYTYIADAGSTGCNRFSGRYELSGGSLGFGPLAAT